MQIVRRYYLHEVKSSPIYRGLAHSSNVYVKKLKEKSTGTKKKYKRTEGVCTQAEMYRDNLNDRCMLQKPFSNPYNVPSSSMPRLNHGWSRAS